MDGVGSHWKHRQETLTRQAHGEDGMLAALVAACLGREGSKPLQMTFRFLTGGLGGEDEREAWWVEGTDEEVCFGP